MSLLKTGRPTKKEQAITAVQESVESSVRLNANVPKSFYKQIKQRALDQNTTVTEIVMLALKEYMSK